MTWLDRFTKWFACWLSCDIDINPSIQISDFQRVQQAAQPGDVWLIEGRSRISRVINLVTRSSWSHAALYVGSIDDIQDPSLRACIQKYYPYPSNEPLLIESMIDQGVIASPIRKYEHEHIRICRPKGLPADDAWRVIMYSAQYLGCGYDTQHIFDLARFLFPWVILPRRWRSSLFSYKTGVLTKLSCSLLIAEAFASIRYPILPVIRLHQANTYEFIKRNPRLFTPRDFDHSPFFETIKYPIIEFTEHTPYTSICWNEEGLLSNDADGLVCHLKPNEIISPLFIKSENKNQDNT
ncbi:MAG: YiiX/YebB-like N1pC/P60 family cysteine hydrolase [Candidatus Berkiella sp.]